MYEVVANSTRIKRDIRQFPHQDQKRIWDALDEIAENPRPPGIEHIEDAVYRLRVGDYRIIYQVFDKVQQILIGKIARRNERTYRKIQDLF